MRADNSGRVRLCSSRGFQLRNGVEWIDFGWGMRENRRCVCLSFGRFMEGDVVLFVGVGGGGGGH